MFPKIMDEFILFQPLTSNVYWNNEQMVFVTNWKNKRTTEICQN